MLLVAALHQIRPLTGIMFGSKPAFTLDGTITVDNNGNFEAQVVVPTVTAGNQVVVAYNEVNSISGMFTVTDVTFIDVVPVIGTAGVTILEITGGFFAAIPGDVVKVSFLINIAD